MNINKHVQAFRTKRSRTFICALLVCAGMNLQLDAALAQTAPAAPNVPAQQPGPSPYTAVVVRNAVEIRDTRTGRAVLAPTHHPLLAGFGAGITSSTQFQTQPEGVDVIVTLNNTSSTTQPLGRLQFGIFNLGENIDYLWSRMNAEMKPANSRSHIGKAWMYPTDLYSPVMVMRNQDTAIGVSLQYPVLDYRHDVRVSIASPGNWAEQGEAGRGWFLCFDFRNFGGESVYTRMNHEGSMAGGETRTYVVSIRITPETNEWIRTLLPYRDYFRSTYGAVRYQRDVGPIRMMNLADSGHTSDSNPLGFAPHQRPDLRGFGPVVRDVAAKQWDEVMFWTPTGLYNQHPQLNWPYHMASTLDENPGLNTAFSSTDGFPWLVNQGTRVGFWWGRSADHMAYWDAPVAVPFNPADPVHVAAAYDEMDSATRAGATVVGLDTFTPEYTPMWTLLPWLENLMARYPNVKFITEPSQCDILHTHAGTWYDGWIDVSGTTTDRNALFHMQGPNVLSDFLNPGSESWVGLGYRPPYLNNFGRPSNSQILADLRRHAQWGYRTVVAVDIPQPTGLESAASWEFTLPPDIRDNDPFIANIRAGRLPGVFAPPPQPDPAPNPSPNPNPGGSDAGTDTTGTGSGGTGSGGTNPTGTGSGGTGGTGTGGTGTGGTGSGGTGAAPNPIIVVVPPTNPSTPPSGGGNNSGNTGGTSPQPTPPGGGVPDDRSSSLQYTTSGGAPTAPAGNTPSSGGGSTTTGSTAQPPAPATRPVPRFSSGTSRRRTTPAVVVPANQQSRVARTGARPAPLNGPVTPPSIAPQNQNPQPAVSQPRISRPSTTSQQAGGALRRGTSTQASSTRQTGTVRRSVAPSRATQTGTTSRSSSSQSTSQNTGPTTVTNTPPAPAQNQQPPN